MCSACRALAPPPRGGASFPCDITGLTARFVGFSRRPHPVRGKLLVGVTAIYPPSNMAAATSSRCPWSITLHINVSTRAFRILRRSHRAAVRMGAPMSCRRPRSTRSPIVCSPLLRGSRSQTAALRPIPPFSRAMTLLESGHTSAEVPRCNGGSRHQLPSSTPQAITAHPACYITASPQAQRQPHSPWLDVKCGITS